MKQTIDWVLSRVLIGLLVIMLIAVLWQVFSRYFLQVPSSFTEELARFLLIWIGMLGTAYTSGQRMHLAITLFPNRLSGENRRKLNVILNLLILAFAIAVLGLGGGRLVYITYFLHQNSPAMGLPMALVYAIVPMSGIVIATYTIEDIIYPTKQI